MAQWRQWRRVSCWGNGWPGQHQTRLVFFRAGRRPFFFCILAVDTFTHGRHMPWSCLRVKAVQKGLISTASKCVNKMAFLERGCGEPRCVGARLSFVVNRDGSIVEIKPTNQQGFSICFGSWWIFSQASASSIHHSCDSAVWPLRTRWTLLASHKCLS